MGNVFTNKCKRIYQISEGVFIYKNAQIILHRNVMQKDIYKNANEILEEKVPGKWKNVYLIIKNSRTSRTMMRSQIACFGKCIYEQMLNNVKFLKEFYICKITQIFLTEK